MSTLYKNNKTNFLLSIIFFSLILFGCATPYGPENFNGGYADTQIDGNTVQVSFKGNGNTKRELVEKYLLYRCAEVTKEKGFDYFTLVKHATSTLNDPSMSPPAMVDYSLTGSTAGGARNNVSFGFGYPLQNSPPIPRPYDSYQPIYVQEYKATAVIKMFKGKKPTDLLNSYDADELLNLAL